LPSADSGRLALLRLVLVLSAWGRLNDRYRIGGRKRVLQSSFERVIESFAVPRALATAFSAVNFRFARRARLRLSIFIQVAHIAVTNRRPLRAGVSAEQGAIVP
jgi:hypothetical protein